MEVFSIVLIVFRMINDIYWLHVQMIEENYWKLVRLILKFQIGKYFLFKYVKYYCLSRHRRKVQYARKVGLQRLWDFIMRIVTGTTMPWRIVVGRLGRLGHGELKSTIFFESIRNFDESFLLGWGIILSKKNLVRYANIIRESCPMCHILRSHDHPVILSACLISMETHPLLTVLPESFELGEMRGTQPSNNTNAMQNTGQVLNDVSVTHILTLPTSASVQVKEI